MSAKFKQKENKMIGMLVKWGFTATALLSFTVVRFQKNSLKKQNKKLKIELADKDLVITNQADRLKRAEHLVDKAFDKLPFLPFDKSAASKMDAEFVSSSFNEEQRETDNSEFRNQ